MVKTYKRSDTAQLSKNFRLDEFKCKCKQCDPQLLDDHLVELLQKLRDHFGRSVHVNSGYRCESHNVKVGGSPSSHHKRGMAADIRIQGITPEEVAQYAESIGIQRIGLYDNFVHIGSDSRKKFWLGHEGTPVDTFSPKPKTVTLELPVLKKGMKCETVGILQALLISYGYNLGDSGADDSFGAKTENALMCYQEDVGLKPDGSCGRATWSKLLGV